MAYYVEQPPVELQQQEFNRGEVWYVLPDQVSALNTTSRMGRPGLIISCDAMNASRFPCVIIAFLTASPTIHPSSVPINSVGRSTSVTCNRIFTVEKDRLTSKMGNLTEDEMRRVDAKLVEQLGITIEIPQVDETAMQIERDLYKRLYERALEKLSEIQFIQNMGAITKVEKEEPELYFEPEPVIEEPKPKKTKKAEEKPVIVDINTATMKEIMKLGFSASVASGIYKLRPYDNVDELRLVPGVTAAKFESIVDRITCESEIVTGKVNINRASVEEMVATLNINERAAMEITRYRKKHGGFVHIDELLNVTRFGPILFNRVKDLVEV